MPSTTKNKGFLNLRVWDNIVSTPNQSKCLSERYEIIKHRIYLVILF